MKRIAAIFLTTLMVLSALTGCGASDNAGNGNDTGMEMEGNGGESKDATVESGAGTEVVGGNDAGTAGVGNSDVVEESQPMNQVALKASKDEQKRTAVITFDTDHVQIADDEDSGSKTSLKLELIGDVGSVFPMSCKTQTVQELYDETMDGYRGDSYSVTEMRDGSIAGKPAHFFEVLRDGEIADYYFILEVGNGLCLYNGGSNGYDGMADFEEMLSYAFVKVEEGDGSAYRPPLDFKAESDGNVLTVNFNSGETFVLDYDEQIAEISPSKGSIMYVDYKDEKTAEKISFDFCISKKYDSIEAFDKGEAKKSNWTSLVEHNFPVGKTTVNGVEVFYVYNNEYGEGLFFIPMTEEYAIRGSYQYYQEEENEKLLSLADAWTQLLGGNVEATDTPGTAVVYDYTAPEALGETLDSMTYQLNGVLCQFPTPVSVFVENGWMIPDVYKNKYADIPAGGDVSVAFENSQGDIIYNVVIINQTDQAIALEDGMVMRMLIDAGSKVELNLPCGISLKSSATDIKAAAVNGAAVNGSIWCYSWWDEESDSLITAGLEQDTALAYFEFSTMW